MVSATVSALCIASQAMRICEGNWRRRPDLNRGWRFCRPLPYHLATAPIGLKAGTRGPKGPHYIAQGASCGFSDLRRLACQPKLARFSREQRLERETGFEPATSTLARSHSTTELFPLTRTRNVTHGRATQQPSGPLTPKT